MKRKGVKDKAYLRCSVWKINKRYSFSDDSYGEKEEKRLIDNAFYYSGGKRVEKND